MEIAVLIVISLISIFVGISLKGTDYNSGMILLSLPIIIIIPIVLFAGIYTKLGEWFPKKD